jgi:hypothetical protein
MSHFIGLREDKALVFSINNYDWRTLITVDLLMKWNYICAILQVSIKE